MLSEMELVKACIDGNSLAQKQFYDNFASKMMGVCYRYTQNVHEAEDVMQEGFIRAFRYMKDFRGDGSLEGWVRRIMVTTALNFLKSQKKFRQELEVNNANEKETRAVDLMDQMENEEVMKLVQSLPTGYRTVLNMFVIEGYSHKEIGDMLNIGESTSRSQFTRAKQLLVKKLNENQLISIGHERARR